MPQIRLNSLTFNDSTTVDVADVTVIVGPNNSGKTRALLDILAHGRQEPTSALVLKAIDLTLPDSLEDLLLQCKAVATEERNNFVIRGTSVSPGKAYNSNFGGGRAQVAGYFSDERSVRQHFGMLLFAFLSTEERLAIAKAGPTGNVNVPSSLLAALYRDPDVVNKANEVFRGIFNTSLRLDFSELTKLQIRVGTDIGRVSENPQVAQYQFPTYPLLDEEGDGMRSAATVILCLEAIAQRITLIDEPEAFLHPPQARALGRYLAAARGGQIIISTHSTDLVRGALSSEQPIRIIRLTRNGTENVPHTIEPAAMRQLTNDPLLNSARVLDGIFYRGVIVTEADADRAFYEVVASQVLLDNDFHYTHAQSKQSVFRVVEAYRTFGVPCASILDIDVLNDAGEMKKLLLAHGTENKVCDEILDLRQAIEDVVCAESPEMRFQGMKTTLSGALRLTEGSSELPAARITSLVRACTDVMKFKTPWQPIKERGVDGLPFSVRAAFEDLSARCAARGLFIVPVGELEGWLRGRVPLSEANKHKWIVEALQVLPNLDVRLNEPPWSFIASVLQYLESSPLSQQRESVPAEEEMGAGNSG